MPTSIDSRELPSRLDELLPLASAGSEVILFDGSSPRAPLVPYARTSPRAVGLHAGAFVTSPDFDTPLPGDFWTNQCSGTDLEQSP